MKSVIYHSAKVFGVALTIAAAAPLQAQDIIGELRYQCEQAGGIFDEDHECLDPIEAEGGHVTIELSDVEIPSLRRAVTPRRSINYNVNLGDEPPQVPFNTGNLQNNGGFTANITQQEGLRICFYELEVDVRNCHHAFQNNVGGYNECVQAAGESHSQCLTWVQKLPYEENQN